VVDSLQNLKIGIVNLIRKLFENTENLNAARRSPSLFDETDGPDLEFKGDKGVAEAESVLSCLGCLWQPSRYVAELLDFQKGG